jgi:hypothetical protein
MRKMRRKKVLQVKGKQKELIKEGLLNCVDQIEQEGRKRANKGGEKKLKKDSSQLRKRNDV